MKNIVEFLNNISPLSEQTLALIESIFVSGELKKGDYFVREGVQANEIAFLERGVVRAFYTNKQTRQGIQQNLFYCACNYWFVCIAY